MLKYSVWVVKKQKREFAMRMSLEICSRKAKVLGISGAKGGLRVLRNYIVFHNTRPVSQERVSLGMLIINLKVNTKQEPWQAHPERSDRLYLAN